MKKKVLLSSIATIMLCFCLIAGSTFALFTSQTEVNIAVTAGQVEMTAGIAIDKLESVKGDANGNITDENGYTYIQEVVSPTFTNGGTAQVNGSVLTLDKITPGDKVTFTVSGTNTSNVAIQTRYSIECLDGYQLMSGLVITVNAGPEISSVASYVSPWSPLAVGADMAPVTVTVELPVTAGNEFQNKSTSFRILVEAVQGNAVVDTNTDPVIEHIAVVADADDFAAALADPEAAVISIADDMELTVGDIANKTINAAGNDVSLVFNGTMTNVVVEGIEAETAGNRINVKAATGDLTVKDSVLISGTGTGGAAILAGPNANLTVDNCELSGTGKGYGVYQSGASGSLVITNSTFKSFGSWAIQINNAINGDLVVDGCTFETPDGVLKVLSGVNGDATFTNNTMIGCQGHDGAGNDALVVSTSAKWNPLTCTGTKTVEGNTLDGQEWTQQ